MIARPGLRTPHPVNMDTFSQTFGFVLAIVSGVAMLAIFFFVVGQIKRLFAKPAVVKIKSLIREERMLNIHLAGGKVLEQMRFVGFSDSASLKGGHIPYQLANMVVLENAKGGRILIRADAIKMIEETEGRPNQPQGATPSVTPPAPASDLT